MYDEQLKHEQDKLRDQINGLPSPLRKHYYEREQHVLRDPDTYAVLNYFFVCGLHHFYLGKAKHGLINVLVMALGIIFWQFYGFVLVVLVILIELPQLFRSQNIVAQHNLAVRQQLLVEVLSEAQS